MKIKLVSFEDGIVCIGFRRISSLVKKQFSDVSTYIYNVSGSGIQVKNIFRATNFADIQINDNFIEELIDADVIGFSGMSQFAGYVRSTIYRLKSLSRELSFKEPFIVWGGVHATVFTEDAIKYADAVCIGEGEYTFIDLLNRLEQNMLIDDAPGFWVKKGDKATKNACLPLMTSSDLSQMPFQDYSFDIWHVTNNEISKLDKRNYIFQQGSKYTTIWSLGCPFNCTYCANSKFIKNNPENAKTRYAPVEYIIEELTAVLKLHDYTKFIEFEDDNFMLIKYEDIKLFSELYAKHVGLPFFVAGIHPTTFDRDKIDLLVKIGLKKVRMGIQSGSYRILSFYERRTPRKNIYDAANYLASLYPQIAPPFYDIILDNPFETEKDKMSTISLLYELRRPFFLYIYSLRTIPGTPLYEFAEKNPKYKFIPIAEKSYQFLIDKRYGFLAYLLALWHPPKSILKMMIRLSKYDYFNKPALFITQILYVVKRGYWELKISNFQPLAMLFPKVAYFVYCLMSKCKRVWSQ